MKASELMIGDWVKTDDGISKVVSLPDAWHIDVEDNDYTYDEYQVYHIPLTEEILKANELDPIICCNLSMPKWFMSIRSGNSHVEMSFKYVHELQHALRFCGLNELADNFKIE